jgi:hypothetical protein
MKWSKEKGQKDKQRSIKHTQQTKDWGVTRMFIKHTQQTKDWGVTRMFIKHTQQTKDW